MLSKQTIVVFDFVLWWMEFEKTASRLMISDPKNFTQPQYAVILTNILLNCVLDPLKAPLRIKSLYGLNMLVLLLLRGKHSHSYHGLQFLLITTTKQLAHSKFQFEWMKEKIGTLQRQIQNYTNITWMQARGRYTDYPTYNDVIETLYAISMSCTITPCLWRISTPPIPLSQITYSQQCDFRYLNNTLNKNPPKLVVQSVTLRIPVKLVQSICKLFSISRVEGQLMLAHFESNELLVLYR